MESLRNDARESKDVSRFYQPLVQVFEYDKQMLMLYRVMHMQRDKLDYKYSEVSREERGEREGGGLVLPEPGSGV